MGGEQRHRRWALPFARSGGRRPPHLPWVAVKELDSRVQGLGFRVQGLGFRAILSTDRGGSNGKENGKSHGNRGNIGI